MVRALGHQQDQRAVAALTKVLRNRKEDEREDDEFVRYCAARSLGMIGGQSAFKELAEVFWNEHETTMVRSGAVQGIAMFRENDSVLAMLHNLLFSEWPFVTYELKISIVDAMGEFGDPRAVKALTGIVWWNGRNELAFSAAMSAVKLTDGAIDEVGVVRAIQDHKCYDDGVEVLVEEKREALRKIAENGKTFRVRFAAKGAKDPEFLFLVLPIGCSLALFLFSVAWYIIRQRLALRKKMQSEKIDE